MLTVSLLAALAAKSVVLAGATLALLRLARRRTPAERSLIAHLGLLAILLVPLAALILPEWAPLPQHLFAQSSSSAATSIPLASAPPAIAAASGVDAASEVQSSGTVLSLDQIAVWVYAVPLIIMFALMSLAVLRLFGMRRRAEVLVDGDWLSALAGAQRRMGFKHGTALLVSAELRSPISWGVVRPTILLDPRAASSVNDAEAIIAHEMAHVARLDWAKLLVARLACALFWFNPLVWALARESHHLREEAADDSVLLTDIAGSDYATLLVNAARHDNSGALIAAHGVAPGKNSLRRRIVRVLDADARRGPARTGWSVVGLVAVLAIASPLAAFTTVATQAVATAQPPHPARVVHRPAERSVPAPAPAAPQPVALTAAPVAGAPQIEPKISDVPRERDGKVDIDALIAFKATGVTPAYISEMRDALPGSDPQELIGARAVGMDAAYARAMRAIDPQADLGTLIGARAVGVTPDYAQEMRRHFPRLKLEDLISMYATGVTVQDIKAMRASGMDVASPEDVVGVRAITGRRGPPARPRTPRPPRTVRVDQSGTTTIATSHGTYTVRTGPKGTARTVAIARPPEDEDR